MVSFKINFYLLGRWCRRYHNTHMFNSRVLFTAQQLRRIIFHSIFSQSYVYLVYIGKVCIICITSTSNITTRAFIRMMIIRKGIFQLQFDVLYAIHPFRPLMYIYRHIILMWFTSSQYIIIYNKKCTHQ